MTKDTCAAKQQGLESGTAWTDAAASAGLKPVQAKTGVTCGRHDRTAQESSGGSNVHNS